MTLNEIFGEATRSEGRRFTCDEWSSNRYFEPIFKDKFNQWAGVCEDGSTDHYSEHYMGFKEWTMPTIKYVQNNWKDLIAEKELSALREIAAALKKAQKEEYCNVPQYVDEAINNLDAVAIVKLWSEK